MFSNAEIEQVHQSILQQQPFLSISSLEAAVGFAIKELEGKPSKLTEWKRLPNYRPLKWYAEKHLFQHGRVAYPNPSLELSQIQKQAKKSGGIPCRCVLLQMALLRKQINYWGGKNHDADCHD